MNSIRQLLSGGSTDLETMLARLRWREPDMQGLPGTMERRRSRRLAFFETGVSISAPSGAGRAMRASTSIVDVSHEGLGVAAPVPMSVGTVIAVECSSGFAVGSVQHCQPHEGAYRWGISLENCVATNTTIRRLMELAENDLAGSGRTKPSA